MKLTTFLALLFCTYSTLSFAETKIYRWIDSQGKTHFSDTAPPGTPQITVENKNLVSNQDPIDTRSMNSSNKTKQESEKNKKAVVKYQAEIVYPQDDTAIRSNEGTLEINVKTTPEKESTQLLQLYLDGQALGSPQMSPTIRALNVDRGTHQVQAHLLGEDGKVLAKTQIVTIHLQRISIK